MRTQFDHHAIEKKWQKTWEENAVYRTDDNSNKPKAFILDMFPYPSGEGLHVGHPKGYFATDIYSRFKRMTGHEVLHPMGWDAFGLPAENFAIKHKVHPQVAVQKNVARFKKQLKVLGLDYDWKREINTTDPTYYKWTQWLFIQLLKKGLAYQSHEPINWCSGCQTGLANEDLESDGTCERCGSQVEKRPMRQWILKIREYADRLLDDLDTLAWPEHIKEAQRNWIGRSEGAELDFTLSTGDIVTVFTTRPDTLFGATALVLAPEHQLVSGLIPALENQDEVLQYIEVSTHKEEKDRLDETKEKTGVQLAGITATNPGSGREIPVYVADYVLAGYGTGAIMAVPAHDERDFAFARTFSLPVVSVIAPQKITHAGAFLEVAGKPGTFLFQKRDANAPTNPNKIGLFGGGIEAGESVIAAVIRELKEELEIEVASDDAVGAYSNASVLPDEYICVTHFKNIDPDKAVLHEGEAILELTLEEALARDNLASSLRVAIEQLMVGGSVMSQEGVLHNSGQFDGMSSEEAKRAIVEKVGGRIATTYKIRDWVFSRQRYWGEPIPVVHAEDGTVYPIAEEQLPVVLPEVEHYEPAGDGQSPLANIAEWVNVTGYVTEKGDFMVAHTALAGRELIVAKRETNTMPQWAGSSWYYLRYMDPHNDAALVEPAKERYWAPVDVYVGGDHAVRHLIYARFWHKFLYDEGHVSTPEPFERLEFLGFILAEDGRKMSKRWGNIINPDDVVARVGADAMRVYEMFMGPFENTVAWSEEGLSGARRFLERVYGLKHHCKEKSDEPTTRLLHITIRKVAGDIERFKFNTAVSAMMIFLNTAEANGIGQDDYKTFLRVLAPFAPHLAEECWQEAGNTTSVHLESYPDHNEALAALPQVTIGVQLNGKVRGHVTLPVGATKEEALKAAYADTKLSKKLSRLQEKVIYVPNRILNIVLQEPKT